MKTRFVVAALAMLCTPVCAAEVDITSSGVYWYNGVMTTTPPIGAATYTPAIEHHAAQGVTVLRDTKTGDTSINGVFVQQTPMNWKIVALFDFDGDGKTDVLWRDERGILSVWIVDGSLVKKNLVFRPD